MDDSLTMNSTCAEKYFRVVNVTVLPIHVDSFLRVLQIIYAIFLYLLGGLLNGSVLVFILKTPKLRTVSFAIAFQLCLSNVILVHFFCIPIIISHIANHWIMDLNFCIACGFTIFTLTSLRNTLIFIFFLDRFASVFLPFLYPKQSPRIAIAMCILSWVSSIVYSIVAVPQLLDCYIFSHPILSCFFSYRCSKRCQIFNYVFILSNTFPTTAASVFFFLALFIKGRIIRYKESKINGIKGRNMLEQEWRAIKTFSLILLALIVVVVPSFIIANIANSFGTLFRRVTLQVSLNAIFFLVITDALIVIRNADFKECLTKLFKPILIHLQKKQVNEQVLTDFHN